MNFDLGAFAIAYGVFLFSTTLHEYGHARIGHILGSRFADDEGLVTLDPIPHIKRSPFGMLLFPVLTFWSWGIPLGWASVPYDPLWAQRHPRQQALMSLAGPGGNLLLAVVAFALIKILLATGTLVLVGGWGIFPADGSDRSLIGAAAYGLRLMLILNIALGIFNLIPIPPLDGAGVVEGFFERQTHRFYDMIRRAPLMGLLLFLIVYRFGWQLIQPVIEVAFAGLRT